MLNWKANLLGFGPSCIYMINKYLLYNIQITSWLLETIQHMIVKKNVKEKNWAPELRDLKNIPIDTLKRAKIKDG